MKIAIFGDSYADEIYNPKNLTPWPISIRRQEEHFTIDNFSQSGSSFYFSITEFFKNHSSYDKVIFIVTHPGRLWAPKNTNFPHISNMTNCELRETESNNLAEKTLMNSARNYLRDVQNMDEEIFKHHCMFEKIKSIRDNVLFIPVEKLSIPNYNGLSLLDISMIDIKYYNSTNNFYQRKDVRCCHMNQENNKILANRVLSWLKGGEFIFDINDYQFPIEKENEIWEGPICL